MAILQVISFSVLVSMCLAEPPVRSGDFGGYAYPSPSYNAPVTSYGTPSNSYSAPSSGYSAPSSGYGAPSSGYTAPSSSYNAPSSSYNAPSTSYNAPSNSYNAPSYSAPSNSYKAPSTNYGAPSNQGYSNGGSSPSSSYGAPSSNYESNDEHHHHGGDDEYSEPKSYEFGYAVKDPYTGNDYDRKEMSDGNTVKGEYRVQLPDGRTQIVTYHADWKTGFHADVKYEGEAKYPETSGYTGPKNQFGSTPNSVYGAPSSGHNNNQYNQVSSQYGAPPSGSGGQYQSGGDYNGFGGSNKYDSYASGGFGNQQPSAAYGTPSFH